MRDFHEFAFRIRGGVTALGRCGLVLAVGLGATASGAQAQVALPVHDLGFIGPGWGQALTAEELAPYDITVFPDGRGLPRGQGSVRQGRALYAAQCASCHGPRGIEGPAARLVGSDGFLGWDDPLRPLRLRKHPLLLMSVEARWPHATTLFDYIRRAMPYQAPKSLTDNEVYAVTAYLLHRQGLVGADAVMNAQALAAVVMPAASRTTVPSEHAHLPGIMPSRARMRDNETLEMPR